jgi:hypothetical protein
MRATRCAVTFQKTYHQFIAGSESSDGESGDSMKKEKRSNRKSRKIRCSHVRAGLAFSRG